MNEAYPFVPKSTARLSPGDYWDIPLSNGGHAVGVVVAVPSAEDDPQRGPSTRTFVAGLLDWCGPSVFDPGAEDPAALLDWGRAHIKTITSDGGQIIGNLGYELTKLRRRSHGAGEPMWVYENGTRLGTLPGSEARSLPVAGTYGYDFLGLMAERIFVQQRPLPG